MRKLVWILPILASAAPALACSEQEKGQLEQWGCSPAQVERKCNGPHEPIPVPGKTFPKRVKQGIQLISTRKSLQAPLRVETPPGDNYFVKLVRADDKKKALISFFIFGGGSFQTNVPVGTYILRYAIGKDWYGPELLFGPCKTSFFEANTNLEFTLSGRKAIGHRVVLIKQVGGNLATSDIDEGEF
jgi:hypothetical protein